MLGDNNQIHLLKLLLIIHLFPVFYLSLNPQMVHAHPLDEFGNVNVYDQKQTVVLTPQRSNLVIDLTLYPTEKIKVWESIDTNRDQKLSSDEKMIWMKKGQEASFLETAGQKINFTARELQFPDYYDFFSSKPKTVTIKFAADRAVSTGEVTYYYKGKDKQLGEIELQVAGQDGFKIENLEKTSTDSVKFMVVSGSQGDVVLGVTTNDRLNGFLNRYVKVEDLPARLIVFALAIAFVLGALHALTPGHGKAIVASYLVGSKGTVWHALNLGLIVTITHTASVFLLGLGSVWLTVVFVPNEVIKTLNIVSGVSVLAFGLYLMVKRTKNVFSKKNGHGYHHHHEEIEISWKNLLPLGISGGIVPCVDALAILIVAVSLGKIVLGMSLLVAFSFGLATALTGIGIITVAAKAQLQKRVGYMAHIEKYISLVSAGVVALLGIGILLNIGI